MSIASEIQRLMNVKASLKSAIESRGIEVDANKKIDEYTSYITSIVYPSADQAIQKLLVIDDGEGNLTYIRETEIVGDNYVKIVKWKFNGNTQLKSILIPSTVIQIGENNDTNDNGNTFQNCTNLEYINLENIEIIGLYTFRGCTNLKFVNCFNLNKIWHGAFQSCSNLIEATLYGTLTKLNCGYCCGTFQDDIKLKIVKLAPTIIEIGRDCFNNCPSLESVENIENLQTIGQDAFKGCTKMGGFTLTNARTIGQSAFSGVNGSPFYLGTSITSIGNAAFNNNTDAGSSLAGVVNLPNLSSLGNYAFTRTHITEIQCLGSITGLGGIAYGRGQFYECKELVSVNLPSTLATCNGNSFQYCTALTTVTKEGNSLFSIGNNCFDGCSLLSSFPFDKVSTIDQYAFRNCIALTGINGINITSIGPYCFAYCSNLTGSLNFPNLTSLGSSCFRGTKISSIISLGNITSIDSHCFRDNSSLTSVVLPSTITSIGQEAFRACSSLTSFTIYATTPPTLGSNVFYGINSNMIIYVPTAVVSDYQSASGWSSFASKIQAIPS